MTLRRVGDVDAGTPSQMPAREKEHKSNESDGSDGSDGISGDFTGTPLPDRLQDRPRESTGNAVTAGTVVIRAETRANSSDGIGDGVSAATLTPSSRAVAPCRACGGLRFWLSDGGSPTCAVCHPPASPEFVREWVAPDASQNEVTCD